MEGLIGTPTTDLISTALVKKLIESTCAETMKGLEYNGCKAMNRKIVQGGFDFILKKLEDIK